VNLREAAAEEAVLKTLLDVVDAEYKAKRAAVQHLLDEVRETTGTTRIDAALPDGTVVAKIGASDPKPEAKVVDVDAFRAWVQSAYPDEVERKFVPAAWSTSVRSSFAEKLLGQMTAAGVVCDPETGETVPGVEIRATRARTHAVRFEKSGRADIIAAFQAGRLSLPDLLGPPELPPAT
jgi:hypothetical protein